MLRSVAGDGKTVLIVINDINNKYYHNHNHNSIKIV